MHIFEYDLIWLHEVLFQKQPQQPKQLGDDPAVPKEVPWVGLVQVLPGPASLHPLRTAVLNEIRRSQKSLGDHGAD